MLKEKSYTVYRIVGPGQKIPVGELFERRRKERKDNTGDMLRLARKLYSSSTFEALEISVEPADRIASGTPGWGEER